MKTIITTLVICFWIAVTGTSAQTTLYVKHKNGTLNQYMVSNLQKLSHTSGNLVVTLKNGSSTSFALSGLRYVSHTNYDDCSCTAPTNIGLSVSSINENLSVGTVIGTLTSTSTDVSSTYTYSLVSGTGSNHNASFSISGNSLRSNALFDYETQNIYSIRLRTTNQGGLWFEKIFTINIIDQADPPSIQATNITASNIQENSMDLNWTNGNGTKRVVFMCQGTSGSPSVNNYTSYQPGIVYNGIWKCVFRGIGSTVTVNDITPGTSYLVRIYEYNGTAGNELYNMNTATGNPLNIQTTAQIAPTNQANNVICNELGFTSFKVSWSNGNGSRRIVFVSPAGSNYNNIAFYPYYYQTPTPINNATYTASPALGAGSQLNGWSCVYNGTGNDVTVTNGINNANYSVIVFEYNGVNGSQKYLTTKSKNISGIKLPLDWRATNNKISGKVFNDLNKNGVLDAGEKGVANVPIRISPYYTVYTSTEGNYSLLVGKSTFSIAMDKTWYKESKSVLTTPNITSAVTFSTYGNESSNLYGLNSDCPSVQVSVSGRYRVCFRNSLSVLVSNVGLVDAQNVKVMVTLPTNVHFKSANTPYTLDDQKNYVFDVGTLTSSQYKYVTITDSVACITKLTGQTVCTKAWATSSSTCLPTPSTTTGWDKSSMKVTGKCVADTLVRFVVFNTGENPGGNMQGTSEYRLYMNATLIKKGTFQIKGRDSMVIGVKANGKTFRLEADQRPGHPGKSRPNAVVEACGHDNSGGVSLGFVNSQPQDDEPLDIDIQCLPIINSYDPNDKQASPSGLTENGYVMPKTPIEYMIRFQNTGSDTAFTVVVVDTLSKALNPATIELGASSHSYELNIVGKDTSLIIFAFKKINLPDSTTNNPGSNGFVKFTISPYDTIPENTVIKNTADIYFDYNEPIRTNTVKQILNDTILDSRSTYKDTIYMYYAPLNVEQTSTSPNLFAKVYPNPATESLFVEKPNEISELKVQILSLNGQLIFSDKFQESRKEFNLNKLNSGVYIIKVSANGVEKTTKFVKQ